MRFALKISEQNYDLQVKIADRELGLKPVHKLNKSLLRLRAQGKGENEPKHQRLIQLTERVNHLQNDIKMSLIRVLDFKQNVDKKMREEAFKKLDLISRYDKLEKEVRLFRFSDQRRRHSAMASNPTLTSSHSHR